ncbi:MAG: hypothetical protein IJO91_01545, partial [Oscillospiraceae bacterium]|nr:hypothetical protein [Oscillospiraceae bacterium]
MRNERVDGFAVNAAIFTSPTECRRFPCGNRENRCNERGFISQNGSTVTYHMIIRQSPINYEAISIRGDSRNFNS